MAIGIDCGGRKISIVGYSDQRGLYLLVDHEFKKESQRSTELRNIASLVDQYKMHTKTDVTFVEAAIVAGARNIQSSLRIAQVTGIVQSAMYDVSEVAVAQWKKAIVGRGNANKEDVRQWVENTYPNVYSQLGSQDAIDGFCIALYGEAIQGRVRSLAADRTN